MDQCNIPQPKIISHVQLSVVEDVLRSFTKTTNTTKWEYLITSESPVFESLLKEEYMSITSKMCQK